MATDTGWLKPRLGAVVLIALVGALAGSVMMGTGMIGPGMMWGYGSSGAVGGLGMALGMLAMLAFWIALITSVILLVRWAAGQAAVPIASTGTDDPVAILKRRYAAGELDQPTYERMKQE